MPKNTPAANSESKALINDPVQNQVFNNKSSISAKNPASLFLAQAEIIINMPKPLSKKQVDLFLSLLKEFSPNYFQTCNNNNETLLHIVAASCNDVITLAFFSQCHAPSSLFNKKNKQEKTPILIAAERGNALFFKQLLTRIDIPSEAWREPDAMGRSPLTIVAHFRKEAAFLNIAVPILIKKTLPTIEGLTHGILHGAVMVQNLNFLQLMKSYLTPETWTVGNEQGWGVLHYVAAYIENEADIKVFVSFLLTQGAQLFPGRGNSCLHIAAILGRISFISYVVLSNDRRTDYWTYKNDVGLTFLDLLDPKYIPELTQALAKNKEKLNELKLALSVSIHKQQLDLKPLSILRTEVQGYIQKLKQPYGLPVFSFSNSSPIDSSTSEPTLNNKIMNSNTSTTNPIDISIPQNAEHRDSLSSTIAKKEPSQESTTSNLESKTLINDGVQTKMPNSSSSTSSQTITTKKPKKNRKKKSAAKTVAATQIPPIHNDAKDKTPTITDASKTLAAAIPVFTNQLAITIEKAKTDDAAVSENKMTEPKKSTNSSAASAIRVTTTQHPVTSDDTAVSNNKQIPKNSKDKTIVTNDLSSSVIKIEPSKNKAPAKTETATNVAMQEKERLDRIMKEFLNADEAPSANNNKKTNARNKNNKQILRDRPISSPTRSANQRTVSVNNSFPHRETPKKAIQNTIKNQAVSLPSQTTTAQTANVSVNNSLLSHRNIPNEESKNTVHFNSSYARLLSTLATPPAINPVADNSTTIPTNPSIVSATNNLLPNEVTSTSDNVQSMQNIITEQTTIRNEVPTYADESSESSQEVSYDQFNAATAPNIYPPQGPANLHLYPYNPHIPHNHNHFAPPCIPSPMLNPANLQLSAAILNSAANYYHSLAQLQVAQTNLAQTIAIANINPFLMPVPTIPAPQMQPTHYGATNATLFNPSPYQHGAPTYQPQQYSNPAPGQMPPNSFTG